MKRAICFLLFFCVSFAHAGTSRDVKFIFGDSIWREGGASSYESYSEFLKTQGYTGVDLAVLGRDGSIYCESPALQKIGWKLESDLLKTFLEKWNREGSALRPGPHQAYIDLTNLARAFAERGWLSNPDAKLPSTGELESAVLDISERAMASGFLSEAMPFDAQTVLTWAIHAARGKYGLIGTSPGLENTLLQTVQKRNQRLDLPEQLIAMDFAPYPLPKPYPSGYSEASSPYPYPTIGTGDIVFALARGAGKEVWAGAASGVGIPDYGEHNVFLYRTVQYSPDGYLIRSLSDESYVYGYAGFNFEKDVKKDILEFEALKSAVPLRKKPVVNLVLGSLPPPGSTFPQYIEPVTNALLSNGYDIRVTFGNWMKGADLYYVLGGMEWDKEPKFFDNVLRLLDHRETHFYGTVVLHPQGEIGTSERWKAVRELFKIPMTEKGWIDDLPAAVHIEGMTVAWKGLVPGGHKGMTHIRLKEVKDATAEVVLSEPLDHETQALILKSGPRYLVNGTHLHLESAYFLSKLVGGALQKPAMAYVTAGREFVAALAVDDTYLELKIPANEKAKEWRVVLFSADGVRLLDGPMPARDVFEIRLKPHQLCIAQSLYD